MTWPQIPPHLQDMIAGIEKQIKELKEKGAEKVLEEYKGKPAPITDIEVLELQKIMLVVSAGGNEMQCKMALGEIWNKLLDTTYKNVQNLKLIKSAQKRIDELQNSE